MAKTKKKTKSLKCYKESSEECFSSKKYEEALIINEKIVTSYPKNIYGYIGIIRSKTHDYSCFLEEYDIKLLKKDYEDAMKMGSKKEKEKLSNQFEEYINDCKEVENLRKIKKEITGKELLKIVHLSNITFISQNVVTASSYSIDGKKIKNIYDFINGLFLLICLIFNLIHRNYLLLLTLPFGIFGIINIYSFINTNFFKKGKMKAEREKINDLILAANKRVNVLKGEVKKIDDNLLFLYEQKSSTVLKIPASFEEQIKEEVSTNEKDNASKMFEKLLDNNAFSFIEELEAKTSISVDDIKTIINKDLKREDDELSNYINKKTSERKNKQNELLYMKKISNFNVIVMILLLVISIVSILSLIKNFYEINFISFVIACISGIISMLIYNINNGKHKSISDTFSDNLLSCIFSSTLVYDLIYSSITNELKVTYGFIQMPITFILIFMGFVMLVSYFKYKHFFNKLSMVKK